MACLRVRGTHKQLNRMAGVSPSAKPFTPTQGQYLAFIYLYTRLHRRPPAETDMQEYFRVSPPSVHQWQGARRLAGGFYLALYLRGLAGRRGGEHGRRSQQGAAAPRIRPA